jgi:hypothetical protein
MPASIRVPALDGQKTYPAGAAVAAGNSQSAEGLGFNLIFLSHNSVAKHGYVQREFKLALDTLQEMPEGAIHTIPVRLDDCDVPEEFHELQWCDLFEEDSFERIVQAIRVGLSQRQRSGQQAPSAEPSASTPTVSQPDATQAGVSESVVPLEESAPHITNSIDMEFVLIPVGEFLMGSTSEEIDSLVQRYGDDWREYFERELPQHQV